MPSVFRLGYVDLTTPDLDAAVGYYRDVLGAGAAESGRGSAYLGLGLDHHTLALHHGERPGLGAIGLQVGGAPLAELESRLRSLGLDPARKTDARPGVGDMLELGDVGGHRFQLFDRMALSDRPFPTEGVAPLRLGHVAILTPDAGRLVRFLTEGLGFWTTDWFDDFVTFVTCNREHHVLNIIQAPFATLHHLAFQLTDQPHQFRAADLLAGRGVPLKWGPARHTAGHNIASYHYGADGALVELYSDMDVYVPELGYCEPRPWHADRPQAPKHWPISAMSRWETPYEFDLAAVAFGVVP